MYFSCALYAGRGGSFRRGEGVEGTRGVGSGGGVGNGLEEGEGKGLGMGRKGKDLK